MTPLSTDALKRLPLLVRRGVCDEGADGVVGQVPQEASLGTILYWNGINVVIDPPPRPLALLASTPPVQEGQFCTLQFQTAYYRYSTLKNRITTSLG
jgi:hypothetical protein